MVSVDVKHHVYLLFEVGGFHGIACTYIQVHGFLPLLVSHTKKAVRATLASWDTFCVQPVPLFIVMETKSGKLISSQDLKTEF